MKSTSTRLSARIKNLRAWSARRESHAPSAAAKFSWRAAAVTKCVAKRVHNTGSALVVRSGSVKRNAVPMDLVGCIIVMVVVSSAKGVYRFCMRILPWWIHVVVIARRGSHPFIVISRKSWGVGVMMTTSSFVTTSAPTIYERDCHEIVQQSSLDRYKVTIQLQSNNDRVCSPILTILK